MTAITFYKHPVVLGTATATNGSATVSSAPVLGKGRNVHIMATDGADAGKTVMNVRVLTDDGAGNVTIAPLFPLA